MDTKAEHARREAEVWAELQAELARVPEERWTDPGILPGWSVNDLVWHVAGWIGECAGHLERMREGTFVEPDDSAPVVDAKNAAFAEEAEHLPHVRSFAGGA